MTKTISLIVLLILLVSGSSLAQPKAPARTSGKAAAAAEAVEAKRERIKNKVRSLRAFYLTNELALDQSAAGKLFPILAKFDKDLDVLLEKRAVLLEQLEAEPVSKVIGKAVDEMVTVQTAIWDLESKRLKELRSALTDEQAAKLIVVMPKFERKLQRALHRRGNKASEADDDDDDRPAKKRDKRGSICNPFAEPSGCTE